MPVDPAFRDAHARDVAAVHAALGEDAFAAGWATGAALPLPAAVAEARTIVALAPSPLPESPAASQAERLGLTPRESEVLRLLAEGLSDREIAAALFLSPRTVGWHVTHLLAKLDVESRAAAAAAAIRRGLV